MGFSMATIWPLLWVLLCAVRYYGLYCGLLCGLYSGLYCSLYELYYVVLERALLGASRAVLWPRLCLDYGLHHGLYVRTLVWSLI